MTQGVFSIRFSKETVTFQGYQPLLPDFRVFAPYSWDEFISIILWMGKLRPRECKITQCGKLPLAIKKDLLSHPVPEWGQGEAHWVMPPSSPSSGPLTQGLHPRCCTPPAHWGLSLGHGLGRSTLWVLAGPRDIKWPLVVSGKVGTLSLMSFTFTST